MVTDFSLQIVAADEGALSILFQQPPADVRRSTPPAGRVELPSDVADQLRQSLDLSAAQPKLELRIGSETYKGRAFVIKARGGPAQDLVVFRLERNAALEDAVARVCREFRITQRQREVVQGVALGLTSEELAERLGVKPSTVKAFLRVIMIKMGVTSRAGMVAKLLDYAVSGEPES